MRRLYLNAANEATLGLKWEKKNNPKLTGPIFKSPLEKGNG